MDIDKRRAQLAEKIAERTGYAFRDPRHLFMALTHSSAKELGFECNERLEFLGDAILGHVACEHLFHAFPGYQEGELSVIKSTLVSARVLARAARDLDVDELILVGKGVGAAKLPRSMLADAYEALIAAIYLDSDLETVRGFLRRHLIEPYLPEIAANPGERNYKSLLQDHVQKSGRPLPSYHVAKSVGPDHRKRFQVIVGVEGRTFGPTWGFSKKEAEQKAARDALEQLGLLEGKKTKP